MDQHTILLQARQAGVKLVRFLYCGNDGLIRGKAAAIEALDGALEAGIGLTVARELIGANRGSVDVESTGPSGTTFRIVLPGAG
jgi:glutamine synthetase